MAKAGRRVDVAVVGGGLAGLTAAALLARAGRRVVLCEAAGSVGGRARTFIEDGFHFNLGPHALYSGGRAAAVLRDLGVSYRGAPPPLSGALALHQGRLRTFPAGIVSLLTTGLLRPVDKLEAGRFLGSISGLDTTRLRHLTVAEWAAATFRSQDVRELVCAVIRVATYNDAPHLQSAGAALDQLRLALRGVLYLDGGWQSLVDGLRAVCDTLGVERLEGTRVDAIQWDGRMRGLSTANGTIIEAEAAVLAVAPREADRLTRRGGSRPLAHLVTGLVPVRAACLDVALRRLPQPRYVLAYGIDRPLYFAVHSAVARLTGGDGAMIHIVRYGGAEPAVSDAVHAELLGLLDQVQPGWRDVIVHARFLPNMTVSHAVVQPDRSPHIARPAPSVAGVPGLYIAGDWVQSRGMLADAALDSASRAAEQILAGDSHPAMTSLPLVS